MNRLNFPDASGQRFGKTELLFLQESIRSELFNRAIKFSSPGIISSSNPTSADTPLWVTQADDANLLSVRPGSVLLDNGQLLVSLDTLTIAKPADAREYLLVMQPVETYFNKQVTLGEETIDTLVSVAPKLTWVTLAQYASFTNNAEFLAYYSAANGLQYSHSLVTLRRWSSSADWVHRGQKGSGLVTPSNPHGTSIFDMVFGADGNFWTAFDTDGIVVYGSSGEYPIRGSLVKEVINPTQWLPVNGRWACLLRMAPLYIQGAVDSLGREYAVTNNLSQITSAMLNAEMRARLSFLCLSGQSQAEPFTAPLTVYYWVSASTGFYVSASNNYKLVSNSGDDSILVAGGQQIELKDSYVFDLGNRADFPSEYQVQCNQASGVYLYPRQVLNRVELAELTSAVKYDIALNGSSTLRFMLAGTTPAAGLVVKIEVIGQDSQGNALSEEITFTGSWREELITNRVDSLNKYSTLTSLRVITGTSDITSAIHVQALNGDAATDYLIGTFQLLKTGIVNYNDLRSISVAPINEPYSSGLAVVWEESFAKLKYPAVNLSGFRLHGRSFRGEYVSGIIPLAATATGTVKLFVDFDGFKKPDLVIEYAPVATPAQTAFTWTALAVGQTLPTNIAAIGIKLRIKATDTRVTRVMFATV